MLAADLSLALDSSESPPAEFLQTTTSSTQQSSSNVGIHMPTKASKIQTATKASEREACSKHTKARCKLQQKQVSKNHTPSIQKQARYKLQLKQVSKMLRKSISREIIGCSNGP